MHTVHCLSPHTHTHNGFCQFFDRVKHHHTTNFTRAKLKSIFVVHNNGLHVVQLTETMRTQNNSHFAHIPNQCDAVWMALSMRLYVRSTCCIDIDIGDGAFIRCKIVRLVLCLQHVILCVLMHDAYIAATKLNEWRCQNRQILINKQWQFAIQFGRMWPPMNRRCRFNVFCTLLKNHDLIKWEKNRFHLFRICTFSNRSQAHFRHWRNRRKKIHSELRVFWQWKFSRRKRKKKKEKKKIWIEIRETRNEKRRSRTPAGIETIYIYSVWDEISEGNRNLKFHLHRVSWLTHAQLIFIIYRNRNASSYQ